MAELTTVQTEASEIEEIVKRYQMDVYQLSVKAPVDGVIHNLQINSENEVIRPGETVTEIVPVGRKLVAEVQISSRDVGHIGERQTVTVKFTAYYFARYGGIKGVLTAISPTTIVESNGLVYYKRVVTLDVNHLTSGNKKLLILPGMTVQADIKTGDKTLLGYFMKPIHLSMAHSLRER